LDAPDIDTARLLLHQTLQTMEVDEKWVSGKRYLDMTEYLEWKQRQ